MHSASRRNSSRPDAWADRSEHGPVNRALELAFAHPLYRAAIYADPG
jgi:hypothetical protein